MVLVLGSLLGIHYSESKRLHEALIGKTQEFKKISDVAASLSIKYVEQKKLNESLQNTWKDEKEALEGRVKILSNATYLIRERARKENRSDLSYEGKTVKYVFNEIRFKDGPPIGYVMIFDDGKVVSKIYNHVIDVKTAVSRNEDTGKYTILSKADYILRSGHLKYDGKNWFGEEYPLNIQGGTTLIDPTEKSNLKKKFYLWNPQLNGNLNLNLDGESNVGLGVSLMGYGYTKRDQDYKFLQIGAAIKNNSISGTFIPIMWRPLPNYLNNTYFGLGMEINVIPNYFLGLQIGF